MRKMRKKDKGQVEIDGERRHRGERMRERKWAGTVVTRKSNDMRRNLTQTQKSHVHKYTRTYLEFSASASVDGGG